MTFARTLLICAALAAGTDKLAAGRSLPGVATFGNAGRLFLTE